MSAYQKHVERMSEYAGAGKTSDDGLHHAKFVQGQNGHYHLYIVRLRDPHNPSTTIQAYVQGYQSPPVEVTIARDFSHLNAAARAAARATTGWQVRAVDFKVNFKVSGGGQEYTDDVDEFTRINNLSNALSGIKCQAELELIELQSDDPKVKS